MPAKTENVLEYLNLEALDRPLPESWKVGETQQPENPNIIMIMVDDLGWRDTSLYGSEFYETPNIDRLAAQGMTFVNAYATPMCSPCRAAVLSVKKMPVPVLLMLMVIYVIE